jgi:hypothetical protein
MLTQAATILQPSSISNTNNKTTTIKKSAAIKKSLAKGILLLLDRCCANPTATTTITGADDAPLLLGTQCQDIVTFSMKHNPWMWDLFIKKHSDDLLTLPTAALILTTGLVGQSSAATRARGYSLLALMTTQHRLDDIVGKTNSMLSISNIFSVLYGQLDNYCVHPDVDRREEEEEEEEIVEEEEEEEEKKKEKGSLLSEDFPALLQVLLRLITWLPQEEQQQKQQQLLLLSIACDVGFMLKSPEQLHRLLDVQLLPSTQSSMQNTVGMLAPVDIKKVTTAQALLMVVLEAIATIPKFAMQLLFHDNKNTDKQGSSTSYEDAAAAAEATPPFWSHVGNVLDPGSQHYARLPAEQEVIYWKLVKVIATCLSLHWELTKLLQAASTSSSSTSSINSNRRNTRREDKGPRPCRLAPWTLDTCSWLLSVVAPFTDDCSNSNTGDEMDKASNAMENGLNANNIINSGSRRNNRAILSAKIDSTTTTSNCDAAIVLGSSTIHRSFTSMRMVEGGSEKEEASPVGTTTTTTTTGISSNILSCVFLVPPTIIAHLLGLVKKTNNNNNNNNAIIPPPSLPSLSLEEASTAMTYIQRLISVQTTAHQGLSKPYTVMEGSAHNDAIYVANTLHDLLTALPEEIMIDADQVVEEEEVKEEGDGGQGRAEEGLPTAEVLANAEKPSNVIDKGEDLTNSYTNGAAAEPSGAIEDLMQLFQSPPPAPCPPQQQQRVTTITTNKGDRKHIVPEQRKVSPGLHNDNNLDKPHQEEEGEGEEEAKVIIPNATMVIDRVVIRAMPAMTDEERELMWAAYIADKDRMVDMMGDADYNEWFDEAANPLPMLTKAPDTEAALDALLGGTGNAATDAELSKKRRISTLPKTVEEASFSSPWQASVAGALFLLSEWVGAGAGVGDDNNRLDGVQQQHCVVELMHRCHKPLRKKTVREALKLINPSHTMSAVQAAMKRADAQPTGSTVLHLVYQLHAILEWGGGHRLTPCLLEAYSAVLEVLLPLAVKEEEQEEGQGNAPMPSPSTNTLPPSSTATATKRGGGTSPLHLASSILFSGSLLIHPTVLSPTSSNLIIALTARYLQPADAVVQYTSSLIWGAFFGGHVLSKRLTTTQAENDANINNSTKNSAGNDTNKREGGSNKIKKRKKAKIMQAVQPPWLHLSCKQLEEEVSMSPLPMTDVHTRASSLTALLTLLEPSLEQVMVACQGSVQEDGKYQVMEGHRVLQCIVPAFDATAVIVQALLDHHCPKSEKKADSFNSINNIVAALLATATSTEVELFYKALGRVIECLLIVCMEAAEDLALHINTVVSSSSTSDGLMEAMNCAGPLTALVALSLEFTNIIDQLLDACSGGEDGNDGNDGNDGDDTGGAPGTSAPFNNNYDKKSNSNNKMKELSLLLSLNKVKAAHTQSEEKLSSCLDLLRAFPEDSPMSAMFTKSVEAAPSLLVKMNAHSSLNDVLWMLEKMEGQQGGGGGGGGGGYYSEITDDGSTEEEDSDDDDDDDEGVEGGDAQQQLLAIKQKKRRKGKEIKKNKKKRKMADIQNPYLRAILSESHYGGAREEVVDDGDDLSDLEDFIVYNPGRDYDAFILEHFPTKEEDEVDVDDDGDGEGEGNDLCGGG